MKTLHGVTGRPIQGQDRRTPTAESKGRMNVTLALLADAANVTREGKLNILGAFDIIYASEFPHVHPSMVLVVRFTAKRAEFGRKFPFEINLMDEDGKILGKLQGSLEIEKPKVGLVSHAQLITNMVNISFSHAGTYEFSILVGEELRESVTLYLIERKE